MKHLILIAALLFSMGALAYDGSSVVVKGQLSDSYDITKVSGDMKSLKESMGDGGEGTFTFSIVRNREHLRSAKKIARYMMKHLFPGLTTKEPYPCGNVSDGDIGEGYKEHNLYQIAGSGDGSYDTCTGEGGPGAWDFSILVHLNHDKKSGTLKLSWYEE